MRKFLLQVASLFLLATLSAKPLWGQAAGSLPSGGGGGGAGCGTLPTSPNGVPQNCTSTPSGGIGGTPVFILSGLTVRGVSGVGTTDTLLATDANNGVAYTNSVSVTVTIPTTATLGISKPAFRLGNYTTSTNTLVLTPAAGNISATDGATGAATFTVRNGIFCLLRVDAITAANWVVECSVVDTGSAPLLTVPGTTATNTVAPTANGVVGLTVLATTGTGTPDIVDFCTNSAGACGTKKAFLTSSVFQTDTTVNIKSGNTITANANVGFGQAGAGSLINSNINVIIMSVTAPTIAAAGCGGSAASISVNNGTAAFKINVGTAPTSACTVTMPAATTGWNCHFDDITTQSTSVFVQKQTGAESTTSVTITNFSDVAAPTAFVANDILKGGCVAD